MHPKAAHRSCRSSSSSSSSAAAAPFLPFSAGQAGVQQGTGERRGCGEPRDIGSGTGGQAPACAPSRCKQPPLTARGRAVRLGQRGVAQEQLLQLGGPGAARHGGRRGGPHGQRRLGSRGGARQQGALRAVHRDVAAVCLPLAVLLRGVVRGAGGRGDVAGWVGGWWVSAGGRAVQSEQALPEAGTEQSGAQQLSTTPPRPAPRGPPTLPRICSDSRSSTVGRPFFLPPARRFCALGAPPREEPPLRSALLSGVWLAGGGAGPSTAGEPPGGPSPRPRPAAQVQAGRGKAERRRGWAGVDWVRAAFPN